MAVDTLKDVRKALEDLTTSYHTLLEEGNKRGGDVSTLKEKLKAFRALLDVKDFLDGEPPLDVEKKDLSPASFENLEGKCKIGSPFVLDVNDVEGVKNGDNCLISADVVFAGDVESSPLKVEIKQMNKTTGEVLASSKQVPITQGKCELSFVFIKKDDEPFNFEFSLSGALEGDCKWKSVKIFLLTPQFSSEQKEKATKALKESVSKIAPFCNAIRNERGSISLPIAQDKCDAVCLEQLDSKLTVLKEELAVLKNETEKSIMKAMSGAIFEVFNSMCYAQWPGMEAPSFSAEGYIWVRIAEGILDFSMSNYYRDKVVIWKMEKV